jgi:hypothetical protein
MSESLNANLKAIEQDQPQMFLHLLEELKNGVIGFEIKDREGYLELWEGLKKTDSTNPSLWEGCVIPEASHLILEGFGLGVNLQKALNLNPDSIIVVEPSAQRFLFSLSLTFFRDLWKNKKIFWYVGLHPDKAFTFYQSVFQKPPRSLSMDDFAVVKHPVFSEMYSGFFDRIQDEFQAARQQIRLSYGSLSDSLWGFRNSIENKSFIEQSEGIHFLQDEFIEEPALVVSAGPSLKKSIPKIREIQDRCVIIATDATASILAHEGIEPDFVCSLERGLGAKKYFEAIPKELKAPLVAYPHVPKEVLESYPGPKLCVYRDYTHHLFFESKLPKGVLPSGSSVAHLCVRLADHLGCSEIVLVGQDLSFDPETFQSHSDGIAYLEWQAKQTQEELEKKLETAKQKLFWIPGNLQEKIPTNNIYFSFLKEFGLEKERTRAQIWNATEGGARIPSIEWCPLEKISEKWGPIDGKINKTQRDFGLSNPQPLDLEDIREFLKSFYSRLEGLAAHSEESAAQVKDEGLLSQVVELLDQAKSELESNSIFSAFVLEMNARAYLEIENQMKKAKDEKSLIRLRLQKNWFQEMKAALHQVLDAMPILK